MYYSLDKFNIEYSDVIDAINKVSETNNEFEEHCNNFTRTHYFKSEIFQIYLDWETSKPISLFIRKIDLLSKKVINELIINELSTISRDKNIECVVGKN